MGVKVNFNHQNDYFIRLGAFQDLVLFALVERFTCGNLPSNFDPSWVGLLLLCIVYTQMSICYDLPLYQGVVWLNYQFLKRAGRLWPTLIGLRGNAGFPVSLDASEAEPSVERSRSFLRTPSSWLPVCPPPRPPGKSFRAGYVYHLFIHLENKCGSFEIAHCQLFHRLN